MSVSVSLLNAFAEFSSAGHSGMSCRNFLKICKAGGIVEDKLSIAEVEEIFASLVRKGHKHISPEQYQEATELLAQRINAAAEQSRLSSPSAKLMTVGAPDSPSAITAAKSPSMPQAMRGRASSTPALLLPSSPFASGRAQFQRPAPPSPGRKVEPTTPSSRSAHRRSSSRSALDEAKVPSPASPAAPASPMPVTPPSPCQLRKSPSSSPSLLLASSPPAARQLGALSAQPAFALLKPEALSGVGDMETAALVDKRSPMPHSSHRLSLPSPVGSPDVSRTPSPIHLLRAPSHWSTSKQSTTPPQSNPHKKTPLLIEGEMRRHAQDVPTSCACRTHGAAERRSASLPQAGSEKSDTLRSRAKARRALDAALLFEADSLCQDLSSGERADARRRAGAALSSAAVCDAEAAGMDISLDELESAKEAARVALEKALLSGKPELDDPESLEGLARKARDALQVALLGVEICDMNLDDSSSAEADETSCSPVEPEARHRGTKARDAMGAALILESETLQAGLSAKQLKQIKHKARDALSLALINEAEDLGTEVPANLEDAQDRAQVLFKQLLTSSFTGVELNKAAKNALDTALLGNDSGRITTFDEGLLC
eukprot:gnl/TRDRNA2_/TRDRNA2_176213_c0_seq1.p1 gnl/TRDRNA2_/TRDRNA2_176213_c0~~gnl/TRDRNA2_/TRDRNA2_176213_c0_seq1.p1  ORF type:complete len:617 (+),score=111.01 gnl/TRDRNA2_/TRDRNA2_176213_c0_seq1:42-1853(+)